MISQEIAEMSTLSARIVGKQEIVEAEQVADYLKS